MIEKLVIQNLLSHKHTILHFGSGVNWVVGVTDSGKSAIVRALRWVLKNQPSGFAFRSRWAKKEKTVVTCKFDDAVIVRSRGTSENSYTLNGETLMSFGTEPPEVVADVVNMDDTNIQRQGDQPFLLSMSPPEVARFLNNIANLSDIDEAHTRVAGKMRLCDIDVVAETRRRDEARQQLEKFREIDNLHALADQAKQVECSLLSLKRERSALAPLVEAYDQIGSNLNKLTEIPNLSSISATVAKVTQVQEETSVLVPLFNRLKVCLVALEKMQEVQSANSRLTEAKGIQEAILDPVRERDAVSSLSEKQEKVEAAIAQFRVLGDIRLSTVSSAVTALVDNVAHLSKIQAQLSRLSTIGITLSSVESEEKQVIAEKEKLMPDVCPLCGSAVCHHQS